MSRIHGGKGFWLAELRADGAAFLTAISQAGALSSPTPSCPDWTVGDLIRHLGSVYRRTRLHARTGDIHRNWGLVLIPDDAPAADDEQVVRWFADELAELDAFLEALDPDLPTWNWAPQTKTAAFWHRRLAHETTVHRWDAQLATGIPEPLESKLAGDTVAEVLDTFLPAGRRHGPTNASGLVHLIATDLSHEWYVRLRGAGIALLDTDTLLDDDAHPARATASGSASDLALALWGRIPFGVIQTAGDQALLSALRVA